MKQITSLVVAFAMFGVIFSVLPSAYAQTSDVEISEQTTLSGDLLNDPIALEILQKMEESKRTIAKLDEVTIEFLKTTYSHDGTAIIRVTDTNMDLDPEAVDNFDIDVWSDSDAEGIDLTVTETNEATGIFEGTVFFTTTDESSGHRLRVSGEDTITAKYEYNTLSNPHTTDELDITATSMILKIPPKLVGEDRFSFENPAVLDISENMINTVILGEQYRISTDVTNHQETAQRFVYTVEIVNIDDSTELENAMLEGELTSGKEFTLLLPWEPASCGNFVINFAIHEHTTDKNPLSDPLSLPVTIEGCASTDSTSDDLFASIQQFFASLFS